MPDGWPNQLKIEVKTSRDNQHKLSERDLAGIRPDGYTAVLIGGRVHHGPRWILLPASLLTPGGFSQSTLSQLGEGVQPDLCDRINLIWSDWILDESVWCKLFEQHHMELQAALDWCLQNHSARRNQSTGNVREGRLADALSRFRDDLDRFVGSNGAQQEGFVHQRILGHALQRLGYRLTSNPIGVPDILAVWAGRDETATSKTLRRQLQEWMPESEESARLRNVLLSFSDDALQALHRVLRPPEDD